MSKANLILVLNKTLQKAGEKVDIRFSQVKYALLGAVFVLLTKKVNARLLISRLLNAFIWAAKIVDIAVVGVEVLEYLQCFKIYGM